MKVTNVTIPEYYSCTTCQKETLEHFKLSGKLFCKSKCAWRYLWRKVFGWFEMHPTVDIKYIPKDIKKNQKFSKSVHIGGWFCIREGWEDSKIMAVTLTVYPQVFEKLPYDRKKTCFQFVKCLMEDLEDE